MIITAKLSFLISCVHGAFPHQQPSSMTWRRIKSFISSSISPKKKN